MSKEANKRSRKDDASAKYVRYCLVILLGLFLIFSWVSLLSFSPKDPPSCVIYPHAKAQNLCGLAGCWLSYCYLYWLGPGAYVMLSSATAAVIVWLRGRHVPDLSWRLVGLALLTITVAAMTHLVWPYSPDGLLIGNGGIVGLATGQFLLHYCAVSGTWLILLATTAAAFMLLADALVLRLPAALRSVWDRRGVVVGPVQRFIARLPRRQVQTAGGSTTALRPVSLRSPARLSPKPADRDKGPSCQPEKPAEKPAAPPAPRVSIQGAAAARPDGSAAPTAPAASPARPAQSQQNDRPPVVIGPLPPSMAPAPAPAAQPKFELSPPPPKPVKALPAPRKSAPGNEDDYQLPPTELLAVPKTGYIESQEAQVEIKRAVLQQTLDDFGVQAQVVGHMTGPVISQFELALAPGVKVSQIASLSADMARALAVPGVRVVSPLPNRDTVGIEVPNVEKEMVRLKELMATAPDSADRMQLPLYLGKDAGGNAIVADLASMPHMLLAGTTGSGKSVCINAIIASLLLTRTPEEVRFILIDPKMVEMAVYEDVPHLLCPIVNDMRRAEDILEWAAVKMDERYELLKEAGVKNIVQFNRLSPQQIYQAFGAASEQEKAQIPTHLPYYVIIIDELADLIMTSTKEVEGSIIRIAQKARAVGIHLILATQRPSVNVVTGLIKSNMPCRISFRVASRQESRIVLDQNGADVLLGQGDMLFLQPGTSQLIRAQGTLVDEGELRALVAHCKQTPPVYCTELVRLQSSGSDDGGSGERDELFDQAVEIILASQRGSVSLLQRRLQVGYSRASRIVDQMAEAGILGNYKGSQARECMMTLEQWQALKADVQADRSGASAADGTPTSV